MDILEADHHIESISKQVTNLEEMLLERENWNTAGDLIAHNFAELKLELFRTLNHFESVGVASNLSGTKERLFFSFLEEVLTQIRTQPGSPPSERMMRDVYNIKTHLDYWCTDY